MSDTPSQPPSAWAAELDRVWAELAQMQRDIIRESTAADAEADQLERRVIALEELVAAPMLKRFCFAAAWLMSCGYRWPCTAGLAPISRPGASRRSAPYWALAATRSHPPTGRPGCLRLSPPVLLMGNRR